MAKRDQTVLNTLARVASEHGLPYDVFYRFAHIESGFNPKARTGSYKGLFQLSNTEFRKNGGGNIYSVEDNTRAFARLLLRNAEAFKAQTGITPQGWMLYLTHQQGIAGGPAHINNPNQAAWVNMYNTPEGRQKGVKWAKKAIWGNIPQGQKRQFGRVENVTSGQFVNMWQARYNRASPAGPTFKEVAFDPGAARTPELPERDRPDRLMNFKAAVKDLKLTHRERNLYQRHLNSMGTEGGESGLLPIVVNHGKRFYLVPTLWNGKRLSPDEAELAAKKIGLRNFPQYRTEAQAEARYKAISPYIDKDFELRDQLHLQQMASVPTRNERFAPVPERRKLQDRLLQEGSAVALADQPVDSSPPAQVPELPADPPPPNGEVDPLVLPGRQRFASGKKAPRGGFTADDAERAFGTPFGDLYSRPDQGEAFLGGVPEPPPLLRDIFGSG